MGNGDDIQVVDVYDSPASLEAFGKTLSQLQAVQHKLANGLIALEGVRLTLEHAAESFDTGADAWRYFAAAAVAATIGGSFMAWYLVKEPSMTHAPSMAAVAGFIVDSYRYDPELIDYYGGRWRSDPTAFSETVKLVLLAGRYAIDRYQGKHYAMAQNLAHELGVEREHRDRRYGDLREHVGRIPRAEGRSTPRSRPILDRSRSRWTGSASRPSRS